MSSMGNQNPGQQSNVTGNNNIAAGATGNNNRITITTGSAPAKPGMRLDTKVLLAMLPLNVIFFIYGSQAYTGGRDVSGDGWRAFTSLFLFLATVAMIGRWVRRRI